jgi:hypothetical protein
MDVGWVLDIGWLLHTYPKFGVEKKVTSDIS